MNVINMQEYNVIREFLSSPAAIPITIAGGIITANVIEYFGIKLLLKNAVKEGISYTEAAVGKVKEYEKELGQEYFPVQQIWSFVSFPGREFAYRRFKKANNLL